nr:nuclear transport factor 2 family protein [uncultured Methylophaga sp.]
MTENNKAVLLKANEAVADGDYEGFLSFCSEDTEWTFVGDTIIKGKQAVRDWMTEAYIEAPQFNLSHLIAEGDFVTAIGEITMKEANGQYTRYSYCDVWRFRDGKMVELKAFVVKS